MITLNLRPTLELTHEQFEQICQNNREVRLERTAQGELVVMPPTGGETGHRNLHLTGQLWLWCQQGGTGKGFDSSTGFVLPNGATRSPDAAWISQSRWDALSPAERRRFVPLCPDFVVELRSPNDTRRDLQAKMQEYLDNGLQLGWLIDPETAQVEVYRPGEAIAVLDAPATLSADPVLPGFVLNLSGIL